MQTTIALEGIAGCGKTTQVQKLHEYLSPRAYILPELNQHPIMGEAIQRWREKNQKEGFYFDREDIMLLASARAKSQKEYLVKESDRRWILMDRGIYTAVVFECGRLSMHEIEDINRIQGVLFPDICIVLDCNVEEALRRIDKRREFEGRYKTRSMYETREKLSDIREQYLELAKQKSNIIKIVKSDREEEKVFQDMVEVLKNDRLI